MREQFLCDRNMYDYAAGAYCGVVMPEHVMKKIAKLSARYSNDVKKILNDHKNDLLASDWTLANKMGDDGKIEKQVIINYANIRNSRDVLESRISAFKAYHPTYLKELYLVENREQAKAIAEEILAEQLSEQ